MNRKQRRKMIPTLLISTCPEHGQYSASKLCPCYDKGGPLENERNRYGTSEWEAENLEDWTGDGIGLCPIHGKTAVIDEVFQCGCFDEYGNKIVASR